MDAYSATQPDRQRAAVEERDGAVCCSCGLDCQRRLVALHRLEWLLRRRAMSSTVRHQRIAEILTLRGEVCSARQIGEWLRRCNLWDMDHVVPICEGGHPYDLRNLRTLCPWCHYRETSELAARRADAARPDDRQGRLFDDGSPC